MRVFLIGYMGSGKSTAGRKLAAALDVPFYDLDELFEEHYKIAIHSFFERYDENLFRKLESQLLKDCIHFENAVISTGGGTPCFYDNMAWMNENGLTVYLQMQTGSIVNRLLASKKKRPLLTGKSQHQLHSFVREHLLRRNIFYSQAKLVVPGESLQTAELVAIIRAKALEETRKGK